MTKRQIVRLEMLRRVRDFGTLHQAQFAEGTAGRSAFDAVAAVLDGLSANHKAKMAAAQEGFRAKKVARRALSRHLDDIARSAKIIARSTPGFDDGFRLPERRNDQVLITAARLFLERTEPLSAQFLAFGLPQAFLTTLREQLQAFEAAIAACEDGSRDSAAAQAEIKAALVAGSEAVARLDIIVANHFKRDVSALASWERDRQLRAAYRQRPQDATVQPTPKADLPTTTTTAVAGAFESALRGDAHVDASGTDQGEGTTVEKEAA